MESIGERLQRLRQTKDLSVGKVAKAVGVATSTYREWEYGRAIRGEPYNKLAELFEVSLYEIIVGGTGSQQKAVIELEKAQHHLELLKKELLKES